MSVGVVLMNLAGHLRIDLGGEENRFCCHNRAYSIEAGPTSQSSVIIRTIGTHLGVIQ